MKPWFPLLPLKYFPPLAFSISIKDTYQHPDIHSWQHEPLLLCQGNQRRYRVIHRPPTSGGIWGSSWYSWHVYNRLRVAFIHAGAWIWRKICPGEACSGIAGTLPECQIHKESVMFLLWSTHISLEVSYPLLSASAVSDSSTSVGTDGVLERIQRYFGLPLPTSATSYPSSIIRTL